ncbi:IS91 family transposase [Inhella gelatinilytica]|uniref:IS91 family transposase n=1 Tax=Inhella gelatinilytica TaxID=2795030 RepID=A0A931J085_9BURK|nr:IS91 family transposase [Inhella gelatinilytica]MBH9554384.1 IS91 family transposase [Inhella gelatinilytica]
MATLAEVLRAGAQAQPLVHPLSCAQARVWRQLCACRTALLGGQQLACQACGHQHWQYHSCRNRHCPQCGARAKDAWLQGQLSEVLAVPYVHLVFTLPHALNSLYRSAPRWSIETLFASVAATLKDFAAQARWMGVSHGQPAFSLVLHTWSQNLTQHLHLHAVMACGVLGPDGLWHVPVRRNDFLFPVQALSRVFRGRFMQALSVLARLSEPGSAGEPQDVNLTPAGRRALYRHNWVVYAKAPLGGPGQVLAYLSRYTHRTAIGNERIQALSPERDVVFTVRADAHGGKRRMRLPLQEFIRRFLLHVLPAGVQRIRHYGVLANGCKRRQLARARQALAQPQPQPLALEAARDFMARVARIDTQRCPTCGHSPMRVVASLQGRPQLPSPIHARAPPA